MRNTEEEGAGSVVQLPAIHVEQSRITSALRDDASVPEQLLPMPPPAASTSTAHNGCMSPGPTGSLAYQSPLPPPPPHPLPARLSEYIRPVAGSASSEWSSSRRAGRRSSTGGSSTHVSQEMHIDTGNNQSSVLQVSLATSGSADRVEKYDEEAGGRGLSSEESSVVVTREPQLSLESCLPEVPLEIIYNQSAVVVELSDKEDGQAAADVDVSPAAQPEAAEATAESSNAIDDDSLVQPGVAEVSGRPTDDSSEEKDLDTDDDSLVCVSPPNKEEQSVTELETTADLSSSTQAPVFSESPAEAKLSKHQLPLSPVADTVRHAFLTKVHESIPHETTTSTTTPDEASVAEIGSTSGSADESLTQPSSIAQEAGNDWTTCVTDAGVTYYYNPQTQESQWTPPPALTAQVRTTSDATTTKSSPSSSQDALFAAVAGIEPFASQLQTLLQSGASLHEVNDAGLTPLHVACQCDNVFAASLLLYYGARADGVTSASSSPSAVLSPLFTACRQNNVELMQLLAEYGAQVSTTDRDGNSLLHAAIASQSPDALLLLLDLVGVNPSSSSSSSLLDGGNNDNETPLHLAVKTGYVDAVRALLRYGAATDVEDSLGRSPLVLSIMENQVECIQLLQTTSITNREPEAKPTDEPVYEAIEWRPEGLAMKGSGDTAADLDELQAYFLQLLPSVGDERPELQQFMYQFCNEMRERMSSLVLELQGLRDNDDKQSAQIEQLTAESTSVTQELTKERDELSRTQELLSAQQLELDTLRASHQALASRCEMLDSIARTAQEKLKRERAEHSHYEEQLQLHLSTTTDENARLVVTLSELEATWSQQFEQQQQVQQQQSRELSEEKSSRSGNDDDDEYYYTQYGELDRGNPGNDATTAASYEYPQYYGAEDTRTLTPVEESGEHYYSNDNDNEGDDIVPLDETAATSTPPISPSRVGAVWNKFFENMAVAAERQPVSSSQRQQQQQPQQAVSSINALYKPATAGPTYNTQVADASPAEVFMAIRRSNFAELQRLLLSGMAANVRDIGEKGTPLHLACELGDLDAMKLLCEFAADVEVRDEAGNTPLLVACSQGHYECTKFLLQSAANLSVVNANGDSALHLAAWDGSADCVEILFEYGVDPLATNSFALTPLANLKTRSPLRHKFDDLVDEHPMRKTLVLLEGMEQRALEERDEAEEADDDEDQEQEPERHAASRAENGDHEKSSSNPNQAGERERPSASKTSWKDWLLSGFSAKPKQEEEAVEEEDELNDQGYGDDEGRKQDANVESDDEDDDTSSFEDSLHRYEPLRPPPEIEAELLRAKLQLQRPATLTASRSFEGGGDGEDDFLTSTRMADSSGSSQQQQQYFVAADRIRMMTTKPSKKPANAAANLRARYVDTFNPV